MEESLVSTYIAAGAVILGALVSGVFMLLERRGRERDAANRRRLVRALRDVIAFWKLEELYTSHIADLTGRSRDTVKRDFRRVLREMGERSPSSDATPQKAAERILELETRGLMNVEE